MSKRERQRKKERKKDRLKERVICAYILVYILNVGVGAYIFIHMCMYMHGEHECLYVYIHI